MRWLYTGNTRGRIGLFKDTNEEQVIEIPHIEHQKFWKMIHNSKHIECVDNNMQTILLLK